MIESGISCFMGGGDEARPVFGRLGFVEPVAKPTAKVGFFGVFGGAIRPVVII